MSVERRRYKPDPVEAAESKTADKLNGSTIPMPLTAPSIVPETGTVEQPIVPETGGETVENHADDQTGTEDQPAINFADAVAEAKQLLEAADTNQWRLGELADQLTTKYGENTLKKFADAIGKAPCTVDRYRSVYRAWKPISASTPKLEIAKALQDHKHRADLIATDPDMTVREARELMRQYNVNRELEKHPDRDAFLRDNPKLTLKEAKELMAKLAESGEVTAPETEAKRAKKSTPLGQLMMEVSKRTGEIEDFRRKSLGRWISALMEHRRTYDGDYGEGHRQFIADHHAEVLKLRSFVERYVEEVEKLKADAERQREPADPADKEAA